LRLAGKGEASPRGGRPGNLYVGIRVKADPRFERDGADLHTEASISFPQAALGDVVAVAALDGDEEVEVEAGTQPGETLVLRGKGLPHLREAGRGDLIVHFKVQVPTTLTPAQEEALRLFVAASAASPGDPDAPPGSEKKRRGFFGRGKQC
jgi:molecular chaperone DnaJ